MALSETSVMQRLTLAAAQRAEERAQQRAEHVMRLLRSTGLVLLEATDAGNEGESAADLAERLAELEHARWVREKLSEGWTYAPVRDTESRRHPSLVPWHATDVGVVGARYSADERRRMGIGPLSESERDKDRVRVSDIPELLRLAGLRLTAESARPLREDVLR